MKALSVKQPWVAGIMTGKKTIETRTWSTDYRGPLLICASKTFDLSALRAVADQVGKSVPEFRSTLAPTLGKAVCVCNLVGCRPMTKEDEDLALCYSEPWHFSWVLQDVFQIPSFAVRGQLGLFNVEIPSHVKLPEAMESEGADHAEN
ncbi:ASCH domain-containing protein [bacterium]|nr:ASCH domain-containing protein [bacterium]